ncbi:hypothetical protein [Sporosarcina obsidiansis]|uniref:hypothetical protein n=1 Tax=Sporosarcina obsidiansis TaxID=2660748 RepID=UPI00129A649F|nr:hypothetical protein [Sporosarcina obsidiansis]
MEIKLTKSMIDDIHEIKSLSIAGDKLLGQDSTVYEQANEVDYIGHAIRKCLEEQRVYYMNLKKDFGKENFK